MKLVLILAILIFTISSQAGFKKGNGGNILKCQNNQNFVLDYYEMTEYHKFNFANELNNPQTFFEIIKNRLTKIDEKLGQKFDAEFKDLNNRLKFIDVNEMGTVDDTFVIILPSDCELKQTAIQLYPKILISKPIFLSLDSVQKNILILHEIIYAMMINDRPMNDSRPTRALVSLILSQEVSSMSKSEIKSFFFNNKI